MDEHPMSDIKQRIVDSARELIQRQGYNGFSYRDIAAEVGIRSASIHHHFPAKADLGAAVVRDYTGRLQTAITAFDDAGATAETKLDWFIGFFKSTFEDNGKMCLCGMLGAESKSLPAEVNRETAAFFATAIGWIAKLLGGEPAGEEKAQTFVASMEGALILAKTLGDTTVLDTVAEAARREAFR